LGVPKGALYIFRAIFLNNLFKVLLLLFLDFIVLDLERLEYLPPVVGRPGGGPGGEPGAACALFAACSLFAALFAVLFAALFAVLFAARRRFMRDSYTAADACDAAGAADAADAAASSRGDAAFFGIIYIY
jgi:hypothetical protein